MKIMNKSNLCRLSIWLGCLLMLCSEQWCMAQQLFADLSIRDVCVYADYPNREYYIFGFFKSQDDTPVNSRVDYYKSNDLVTITGPYNAFTPDATFCSQYSNQGWAPEVHKYKNKYYLLTSYLSINGQRGTQILRADSLGGPYAFFSDVTPPSVSCLDGTLFRDEGNHPWLVYSYEWVVDGIGKIFAMQLSETLETHLGNPVCLFAGDDVAWNTDITNLTPPAVNGHALCLEAPYLFRSKSRTLWMLYAGFITNAGERKYTVGAARSLSGKISGPWQHMENPLFPTPSEMSSYREGGGHAMRFISFSGLDLIVFHAPNMPALSERRIFRKIEEQLIDGELVLTATPWNP